MYSFRERGILLKGNILKAVNQAREFFKIDGFPGDFFQCWKKLIILINTIYSYSIRSRISMVVL